MRPGTTFRYAGDSVGGAVGLQLLLDAPERVERGRAALHRREDRRAPRAGTSAPRTVRAAGTPAVVDGSAQRWFAPGFVEREPAVASALLQALRDADAESYALVCEALAAFDVRDRLRRDQPRRCSRSPARTTSPTPPAELRRDRRRRADGRLVVLDGVAHLAPAEAPETVARPARPSTLVTTPAAGMAVRREVLGDAHVDRAIARDHAVHRASSRS